MSIWHPIAATLAELTSILATMASSVDDAIADLFTTRQAESYVWVDAPDRSIETGMSPGSFGVQLDTGGIYTYLNGEWVLTGGTMPAFSVYASSAQSFGSAAFDTVSSAWGTPTINDGFSAWSGGVLTAAEAGIYLLTANILYEGTVDTGRRYLWIASNPITSTADPDFYGRDESNAQTAQGTSLAISVFAAIPAGGTIRVTAMQDSGSSIPIVDTALKATRFGALYIRPLV